jgi:hypothetical protein
LQVGSLVSPKRPPQHIPREAPSIAVAVHVKISSDHILDGTGITGAGHIITKQQKGEASEKKAESIFFKFAKGKNKK